MTPTEGPGAAGGVQDDRVRAYRVDLLITFALDDPTEEVDGSGEP